jgi:hypothetical protein
MALTKSFDIAQGVSAPAAYIRVETVSLVKNEKAGTAVHVFPNADAADEPIRILCYGFDYLLEGPNPIKQAYEHLKTLPEFADAEDC